jgi:hypothetical protein
MVLQKQGLLLSPPSRQTASPKTGKNRPRQEVLLREVLLVNVYAIIIVLCISIDKNNIRTRSLRNTHSQETRHLSWETLKEKKTQQKLPYHKLLMQCSRDNSNQYR